MLKSKAALLKDRRDQRPFARGFGLIRNLRLSGSPGKLELIWSH